MALQKYDNCVDCARLALSKATKDENKRGNGSGEGVEFLDNPLQVNKN